MNEILTQFTKGLKLGRLKSRGLLGFIPVLQSNGGGPEYLTLGEAMDQQVLSITEVSEGGHVPELKVVNRGAKPVLLMDGEELKGAKQNRVINTTILIPEKSERVIPVSCTEQGRWHSESRQFQDSGVVMSRSIRAEKNRSVYHSIIEEGTFRSDQGRVWANINNLSYEVGVRSRTSAMRDVYREKEGDLDKLVEGFTCAEGQKGIIAFIHGEVVGLEVISSLRVFAILFPKILRSYAMEALTVRGDKRKVASAAKGRAFIEILGECKVSQHPSVGYGEDVRFHANGVDGSALFYQNTIIHAAFFTMPVETRPKAGAKMRHNSVPMIEEIDET